MSPRRRTRDHWLPQRVYRGKSAFEYHPRGGGAIRLCSLDAKPAEVHARLAEVLGESGVVTVTELAEHYFKGDRYRDLKPRTQRDYRDAWKMLKPVFGSMPADSVKPQHVRRYMDLRSSRKRANLERICLSNVFSHGVERGMCQGNPCEPVKPFKLAGRDRYVTDAEYQAMYKQAPPVLQAIMEISYTCAARGQDVRMLKLSDITDEGLLIAQQKTGKRQVKLWSRRLREAVNQAIELRRETVARVRHDSVYMILNARGRPYTAESLKTLWARHKLPGMDWTFHDLKAKGISDFPGDRQEFSGHKSRLMMERYNRSPDKVRAIDWEGE